MNIVFRVDASKTIGIGHLMRCLALAEELKKRGHNCFFLSKTKNPEIINNISKYHHNFFFIPSFLTMGKDCDALIKYAKKYQIDWIITDHYNIYASYLEKIKHHGFHILSIDDTAQIHYYSDIIVNQNIGAEKLTFSVEPYTIQLLGTSYIMLREELLLREKKKQHSSVEKMLITLGGSDPDNYILTILQSIASITKDIELLVVIGPYNPHKATLQAYAEKTKSMISLIHSPENMADYYLQADIAISAGGSSCYEVAYFGIPNIIITIADNQLAIAHELDSNRIGIYLGKKNELQPQNLRDKVKELLDDKSLRDTLGQNGKKIVDGKGKKRIITHLERDV